MAKYDWIALEQEYMLSDCKAVSSFLAEKNIPKNGNTKKSTRGWKSKKVLNQEKKSAKTIEKIIEKEATEEAKKYVKIDEVARKLLKKIDDATEELNKHSDMFGKVHNSIIDRSDIKKLTSALKDLNDIIPQKPEEDEDNSFIEALNGKVEDIWDEEE